MTAAGTLRSRAGWELPGEGLTIEVDPAGGPGGQHANRSSTRVRVRADLRRLRGPAAERVRHRLGEEVTVTVSETRSQVRNRAIALDRLRRRLDEASRPVPARRPTRPSRAAVKRRLAAKRHRSDIKRARRRPDPGD